MKLLLFISALCLSGLANSQTYGYFGKKNSLSINGNGSIPIIYWYTKREYNNYKRSGNTLSEGNDVFDFGINVAYTHAFSGSFAFGLEYDLLFGNVKAPQSGSYFVYNNSGGYDYNAYFDMKHEQLSIRTNVFMPKIEYTFSGSQLPFGINNQLGIGYSTTKVQEKDYLFNQSNSYYGADSNLVSNKMIDYDKLKAIKGITIMYAFNIRTPLSKSLMINYGIRYTLNLTFSPESTLGLSTLNDSQSNSKYYTDYNEIKNLVGGKRISSIMNLNLGLTYVF